MNVPHGFRENQTTVLSFSLKGERSGLGLGRAV